MQEGEAFIFVANYGMSSGGTGKLVSIKKRRFVQGTTKKKGYGNIWLGAQNLSCNLHEIVELVRLDDGSTEAVLFVIRHNRVGRIAT